MKKATILVVATLLAATLTTSANVRNVRAVASPVNFTIVADIGGWNLTNPTVTEFRGVALTVTVNWGDCCTHDFAIYTSGFPAASVSTTNTCTTSNTNGCLSKSANVFQSSSSLTFTPTVPKDDLSGLGGYEFYCQFHPGSMHGKIQVYKSPDLDNNGAVNVVDVATVAFSFGATPTSTNWNVVADLNNDGTVNILDVAFDAFYFGQPI